MRQDDADKHNEDFVRRFGYSEQDTPKPVRLAARAWAAVQRAKQRVSVWVLEWWTKEG